MSENRYRQFKDNRWYCTCGKRGSNQTVVLHMWQNVSPCIPINQFFQECLIFLGLLLRKPQNRKMQEGNGVARAGRYEKNALYYVVHNMLLLLWFQRKKKHHSCTQCHFAIYFEINPCSNIYTNQLQSCLKLIRK